MLIYFQVVLVISTAGFLEDLLGCSAICLISDSTHIVSMLKCKCNQNKVIKKSVQDYCAYACITVGLNSCFFVQQIV